MKYPCLIAIVTLALVGTACKEQSSDKVPEGQLSAKMINNPRSADGINPSDLKDLPVLHFADTSHDFGWMGSGERAEHEFTFENKGGSPLVIAGATSSCGCTIPEFSREPIPPGGSGTLKVTFSSEGKQGHIVKAISVSSNAFPAVRVLTISADVMPNPANK